MLIVAGHLVVDPEEREVYLAGCEEVVSQARGARTAWTSRGSGFFALSYQLADPDHEIERHWSLRGEVLRTALAGLGA